MSVKRISALLFVLLLIIASVPVLASGDTEWRSELMRMNDLSDVMEQADIDELNSRACGAVEQYKLDFVLITFTSDMRGEADTDSEYVDYLYENNGLGYGATKDGVLMAVNTDTGAYLLKAFFRGYQIFPAESLNSISAHVNAAYFDGGLKSAFSAFLDKTTEAAAASDVEYDPEADYFGFEITTVSGRFEESGMPYWYPVDVAGWSFTPAAADAPRVVDDADILTPEEEARISARIAEVAPKYNTDIVIFTDVSTRGLERRVYAADFYDFNGYGYGDDHDGFCLFICMDPNARGGWCCVTGERSRSLYTEDNANQLDDVLYDYLKKGEYGDGIYDWVGNIGTLLDKGAPFAPEWFPSLNGGEYQRTHDPAAPRVADDAKLIEAEDEAKLLEKINSIKEKYGVDVLVLTSYDTYGMDDDNFVDAFYRYKGYGLGEDYSGVILGILEPGDRIVMNAYGNATDKIKTRNVELLSDAAGSRADVSDYYGAADRWLDYLDTTLRTGRTPRIPFIWAIRSALSAVAGLIGGGVRTSSAKRSMKTVRTAYSANDHLVAGSCRLQPTLDRFIRNDVTRVYSPVRSDSGKGSGSSGGGSSYSGGYSGSSGSSHSGSGRDF